MPPQAIGVPSDDFPDPSIASPSAASSSPAASEDNDRGGQTWSTYLYIIAIFGVLFLLLGFFYHRKRRGLGRPRGFPRNRFQVFRTHHPSQSRDLSAVQANNRLWRNMRAGPFSHHARMDAASSRRTGSPSTMGRSRSRMDVDEEIPPPYLPEEPERTLDRGPSTREQRESWPDRRRTRDSVNLNDLLRGAEGQEREAVNKPPEYEEGSAPRREGQ